MRRTPGVLGLALFAGLALGCASTVPATNPDGWDGDTGTDFIDTADLPDLAEVPPDVPTETPVEVTEVIPDPGTDEAASGGVVGDACYSATQCGGVPGSGVTCLTSIMGYITFPGGYCSAVCTSDADCGPGGACVNLSDLGRYCLKRCTSPGECRTSESYSCDTVTGAAGTYCIPPFSSPESDY